MLCWPFKPAVTAPQEKVVVAMVFATENVLVPSVVEVAVTWLVFRPVPCAAVKPTGKVVWQLVLWIAAATFAATPAAVGAVVNVPAVELVHAFVVPSLPVVAPVPHEKMPPLFDAPTINGETDWSPGVGSVTITVLPLALAVKP